MFHKEFCKTRRVEMRGLKIQKFTDSFARLKTTFFKNSFTKLEESERVCHKYCSSAKLEDFKRDVSQIVSQNIENKMVWNEMSKFKYQTTRHALCD